MLSDSEKHTFEAVLVYQLDRFARNRCDSAINKAKPAIRKADSAIENLWRGIEKGEAVDLLTQRIHKRQA